MPEPAPHPPDQYGPNKPPEVPLPKAPGPGADTPIPWGDDPEAGDVRPPDQYGPDKPPDAPAVPSVEWAPKVKPEEGWHPAPKPGDVDWVHPGATPTQLQFGEKPPSEPPEWAPDADKIRVDCRRTRRAIEKPGPKPLPPPKPNPSVKPPRGQRATGVDPKRFRRALRAAAAFGFLVGLTIYLQTPRVAPDPAGDPSTMNGGLVSTAVVTGARCRTRRSAPPGRRTMNSLVRVHMPATFFSEYQVLRDELLEILTDDDLGIRVGGTSASLGALCREIGEIEHSYVESFRTFRQDFRYRNRDPRLETSVGALASWYVELDRELTAAVAALSEDDIANRRIVRGSDFSPLPNIQLDIYREALLIFYGKVSVYVRAMGRALPRHWQRWIG